MSLKERQLINIIKEINKRIETYNKVGRLNKKFLDTEFSILRQCIKELNELKRG